MMAPAGETWEVFKLLDSGRVRVTRTHGWLDGTREQAWTRVYSREDASIRREYLKNKLGWRDSKRWITKDNPVRGEWWIDDSGHALYADGDVGDMGHEAYVIESLTRRLLDTMDIEPWNDEYIGDLNDGHTRKAILAKMKEDEFTGVIEEFIEDAAKSIWKDQKQREAAINIAKGRGDARKYGMQYDGWIRVANHGLECWAMTAEILKHMGNGVYDALGDGDEIGDDEIFEIYVHNTGMHYTDVPWSVINEGDPGKLRIYGTKNNPRRRR